jgi:hypothetical protein
LLHHILKRRWWHAALILVVISSSGAAIARYLQMRADYDFCEIEDPHAITGPGGDRIEADVRFCGFYAGDPGTIVVHYRPAGSDRSDIIFAYNPATGEPGSPEPPWYPTIAWTAPDRVLISISRISQIQRQGFSDGKVRFAYAIGKVDYP